MKTIFRDKSIQSNFDKNGFVKIKLLDPLQIEELHQFYKDVKVDTDLPFHVSLDQSDPEKIKFTSNFIEKKIINSLNDHFIDFQVFTSSYVVKEPGKKNIVPPHQDWSFVDENENYSVTCWTPLIDVNDKNGTLAVIKGTHHIFKAPRSSPSPASKSLLSDHVFTLFPYVESINLKAGESLIFDNRLIHASTPNLSNSSRIAVGIGLTGKNVMLKHYYEDPKSSSKEIIEYNVDKDFFYNWNNIKLSNIYEKGLTINNYQSNQRLDNTRDSLSKNTLEQKILEIDNVNYNKELMDHLASLFNYNNNSKEEKTIEESNPILEKKESKNFFKTYTPFNIYKELIWRIKGRPV